MRSVIMLHPTRISHPSNVADVWCFRVNSWIISEGNSRPQLIFFEIASSRIPKFGVLKTKEQHWNAHSSEAEGRGYKERKRKCWCLLAVSWQNDLAESVFISRAVFLKSCCLSPAAELKIAVEKEKLAMQSHWSNPWSCAYFWVPSVPGCSSFGIVDSEQYLLLSFWCVRDFAKETHSVQNLCSARKKVKSRKNACVSSNWDCRQEGALHQAEPL